MQNISVLAYYQTLYETEKRDSKIKNQEVDIELLNTKNKVKNQWLLFGGLGLLSLFGFLIMIRSRNYLKKKQQLQEDFTKAIISTQENERARVAKELHDSIGQRLLILKRTVSQKESVAKTELEMITETIDEVRNISHNLHPFQFEKLGLKTSLENLMDEFQKTSTVFYSYEIDDVNAILSIEKQLFIFRMLQECLVNVEKHAHATACNLTVTHQEKSIEFIIKDNGKGFDASQEIHKKGIGLKNLKERATFLNGVLYINSKENEGTTITIKIPK